MEAMINLNDLFKHEILDLYSVEEQIIEALPGMIEKAGNPELKKALTDHLKVTREHKARLDKIKKLSGNVEEHEEKKNLFTRIFGSGSEKCKGMEGLISEGKKIMNADITPEALDAAIIASAQKIEHYEICGYGTARAYAKELKITGAEQLLTQTLNEEYAADDLLTRLAVGKLNIVAEKVKVASKKSAPKKAASKKSAPKKAVSKKPAPKKAASKKPAPKKAASKKPAPKKVAAQKGRSKGRR